MLEIEIVELQAQLRFTARTDFEKYMPEIGLDRPYGNTHLKGDLLILVFHAGEIRDLSLAHRERQPAVIKLKSIPIC